MPEHNNNHEVPVPGTFLLVDVEHKLNVKHAENADTVLIPSPSRDAEDPLNWTPRRKILATMCQTM